MSEWIYDPKAGRCRKTDGGKTMSDKIAEIRERHLHDERWRNGPSMISPQSHDDRALLLAEVERLTGKLKLVADALNDTISKYHEVGDQVDRLDAENERLRENVDRLGKEVERADRLRAEIARVKADNRSLVKRALEGKP